MTQDCAAGSERSHCSLDLCRQPCFFCLAIVRSLNELFPRLLWGDGVQNFELLMAKIIAYLSVPFLASVSSFQSG